MRAAGCKFAPVATLAEVATDPQVEASGAFFSVPHPDGPAQAPMRLVAAPFRIDGAEISLPRHAPDVGEHTLDVLREHGFDHKEIAAMETEGVVGARPQGPLAKWMQRSRS